jgi:hypothetical protein
MNLNLVGNICGRSSTTTFHKFIPIGQRRGWICQKHGSHRQFLFLIGWN